MKREMRELARKFVAGEMSANEFSDRYISLWSQHRDLVWLDPAKEDLDDQAILDAIHSACDVFTPNEHLIAQAPEVYIDAKQLKSEVELMVQRFHA